MISPVPVCDYALLRRFAFDDDDDAFEELVRRHTSMARGVCRRVLGPSGDADDAAQSAFLSLATHARTLAVRLGPTGSLAGWLYRVAVNAALQQRRAAKSRRRRETKVVRERDPHQEGILARVEHSELLVVLDEELKELPPRYRTPLVLCHLEGKTQQEAASQLGLSYGTLRRRLDRGRKLLRSQLGRRGVAVTSALLAMIWKSSSAQAAGGTAAFVEGVLATIKCEASPVVQIHPRIASAGRVPQVKPPLKAGRTSGSVYTALLAIVIIAMAIPPVVSAMTTTDPLPSSAVPADSAPVTSTPSPGRSA